MGRTGRKYRYLGARAQRNRIKLLIALISFVTIQPIRAQSEGSNVHFDQGPIKDSIYCDYLKTVLFYPQSGVENANIFPAVTELNQSNPLLLEFDELTGDYTSYAVKLIHCNADWSKSQLNDIEFLEEFNEFPVTFYRGSFNTRVEYTHYEFKVPQVKLPGNYVLVMYYEEEPDLIALTRRFSIFDSKVSIEQDLSTAIGIGAATDQQAIHFRVDYEKYNLLNPGQNLKVYVRKNQRNNVTKQVQPTFINEGIKELRFNSASETFNFTGGNEFRKVDIRSTQFRGVNVLQLQNQDSLFQLSTKIEEFQISNPYLTYDDINGQYVIDHYEYGSGETQADYVKLYFQVASNFEQFGKVYLFGAFTDWKINADYEMHYDPVKKMYWSNVKIKQGYYNYKYVIVRPSGKVDELFLDGNHFETENQYEVFFYYTPPGQREDLLIGYSKFWFNNRRN